MNERANPMFTRRHYEAIAAILAAQRRDNPGYSGGGVLDALEVAFVALFERDSPLFDTVRFVQACR